MKPATRRFYESAVRHAVTCVVQSLDQALDLEEIARLAALSPFHFHRVFRGMMGETPLELHRRLRLERAAYFLANGDVPVTQLAFQAGYETHESFTRAFRKHYACSPIEFRRSASLPQFPGAARIELAARSGIHFEPHGTGEPVIQFIRGEHQMNVRIVNRPELRLAAVRHLGPYNQIPNAFARLGELAGPAELIGMQTEMLGLYYDDPETTPAAELRADAALTVREDALLPDGLTERRVPGGRYACTVHIGSYTKLGDTWSRLMGEWLPDSGHRVVEDGVFYEVYRSTPGDTPETELRTELYAPLA